VIIARKFPQAVAFRCAADPRSVADLIQINSARAARWQTLAHDATALLSKDSDARAGARPADKVAHIDGLRRAGHRMLTVGDGLNDTPALSAADVAMSASSIIVVGKALRLRSHEKAITRHASRGDAGRLTPPLAEAAE
jgi:hypothetical protein